MLFLFCLEMKKGLHCSHEKIVEHKNTFRNCKIKENFR